MKIKFSIIFWNAIITHSVYYSNTVYLIKFYAFNYLDIIKIKGKSVFIAELDIFLTKSEFL